MTVTQKGERRFRLWPGVVALLLQWVVGIAVPIVLPDATLYAAIGGVLGALAVLLWWAFFSRVPHIERWGAVLLMIAAVAATPRILHPSIVGGMMGMMFWFSVLPGLGLALVVWAAVSRRLAVAPRRAALVGFILAACGVWALARTDGITGAGRSQLKWRWAPTPEQKLLAQAGVEPAPPPSAPAKAEVPEERPAAPSISETPTLPVALRTAPPPTLPSLPAATRTGGDWPGFRGPHRDDTVIGVKIKTDWATSPPVELWRRPLGPGWSSFAVRDDLLYTQEQRGDFEVVSCYSVTTGKPVWIHRDAARFWESNGGAGPRGTPTLSEGRLFTFGATGILNALNAGTGSVVWKRNVASDAGVKVPEWGFSSSPLVVGDVVIVAASGRLVAYDFATGNRHWLGANGGGSYSSPHLFTIGGEEQVVMLSYNGATSVAPSDGRVLWKHEWPGATIVQPAITADGGVLVTTSDMSGGIGLRRLAVAHGLDGWTVAEVWTSTALKPYFNDYVVHDGHAFGFDGGILACIDLQDGKRNWKGGRYGHGQLLLLSDQGLLLVLTEEGELALVPAAPGQFTEIARFPAMEGKTWNHAVLSGDVLLVRNGTEMVAFRLPLAGS
jgi:outer membrane protein assembly factor BamB